MTCTITGIGTCTDSNVVIPEKIKGFKVTAIKIGAFIRCATINEITIPKTVTSMGDRTFMDCTSLKDLYYTGTEAEWRAISIDSFIDSLNKATIHYNSKNYITRVKNKISKNNWTHHRVKP